jgi:UDP-N-acetylmuramoylalanine--D-glutamate ligase
MSSAKFLARNGAELTVTDMRGEDTLKNQAAALDAYIAGIGQKPARYVLGRHEKADFQNAGMVLKNPGVPPSSLYLHEAKCIETDISIFLRHNPAPLIAVTGSKGKSFTASAIHYALSALLPAARKAYLGGNITVSPLTFLEELTAGDFAVLELSSFQLGDLPYTAHWNGGTLLKPRAAVLTAVMSDHQDRYGGMDAYIADKKLIYNAQDSGDVTVSAGDNWGRIFLSETKGRPLRSCSEETMNALMAAGNHRELNTLNAHCVLVDLGFDSGAARRCLDAFPGIEHRMELFLEYKGIRFYNDSAATIPEAAAACCRNLNNLVLVTGGSDKNLDFSPLAHAAVAARAVVLLAGSGSEKLAGLLSERNIPYDGPFGTLDGAVNAAFPHAKKGYSVALSPGCASFGMFLNEFDRGRKGKETVTKIAGLV